MAESTRKRSDAERLRHLLTSYWRGLFKVYRPERRYMRGPQSPAVSPRRALEAPTKRK